MKNTTRLVAAAVVSALALTTVAADGDDAVGTAAFEELTVVGAKGVIEVSGSSTFGGEELVVGVDAATDGGLVGFGTDITELRISQDPKSGTLEFSMDIDLAAGATAPAFAWSLPFGGGSLDAPQLLAFANDANGVPGDFYFRLGTGGGISGNGGSFAVSDLAGRVDGSTLVWTADPSQLGLAPGDTITVGAAPAYTAPGGSGLLVTFIAGNRLDTAELSEPFGVGGGAVVKILDAKGEVVDSGVTKVRRGVFSRTFDGLKPGTYAVEVITPYADVRVVETRLVKVS